MRKIALIVLLSVLTLIVKSQSQYTPMTATGYQEKRVKVDSTLHIPSFCGIPTLRNSIAIQGALAMDTCANKLYKWTRANGWSEAGGGTGEPTDTTSLSNRINQKVNISDTATMLTNYAKTSAVNLKVNISDTATMLTNYAKTSAVNLKVNISDTATMLTNYAKTSAVNLKVNISDTATMLTPYARKAEISPIDTSNKFINNIVRVAGKDSIIFYKGSSRFAIKDSVGTNPAPVGYYGSFQDTTNQSALAINTAYGVKFGITDLTNGVTVSNNSKIKFANAGIYNIQFSLQLEKTGGSGNMITDIWLRKNNINLDGTNGKIVLTGSANASPVVAAWNYVVAISSNDSLELMWAVDNLNVKIISAVATSPHPSTASAILTVTQQSGIMAGTGISPLDTTAMLSKYQRKAELTTIDTTSLSNRINTKLAITDTTAFQRKSIGAYSFQANKTNAAANTTSNTFRDTTGVYNGTITWTGTTAPSGATTHTYSWTQIGKMVTLRINLVYATVGVALTQVAMTLPADCPVPVEPTGLGAANEILYSAYGYLLTLSTTQNSAFQRAFLRVNSNDTGYELLIAGTGSAYKLAYVTINYFTN